ncbi:MAG: DUF4402 domain-containing protein [Gammaproteobacteria bacterium]|nr:DUF4402 domain-containing protein [Gammaproteobacteria bacterium]
MTNSAKKLSLACAIVSLATAMMLWTPAQAVTAVATVNVNIISTMTISTLNGLIFGDISSGPTAGTIVMTPGGARSATGGANINTSVAGSPASFDVQGDASATYSISLPVSVVLSDTASHTMTVDNFTSSPTPSGVLDGNGQQTLFVGATLNVGSNQAFGAYSGLMSVTVDYN